MDRRVHMKDGRERDGTERDCSFIDIKMLNWRATKEACVFELGCLSSPKTISSGKAREMDGQMWKRGCTSLTKSLNDPLVMHQDNMIKLLKEGRIHSEASGSVGFFL